MGVVCLYSSINEKKEVEYCKYHAIEKKNIYCFIERVKLEYGYTNKLLSEVLAVSIRVLDDVDRASYEDIKKVKKFQYLLAK